MWKTLTKMWKTIKKCEKKGSIKMKFIKYKIVENFKKFKNNIGIIYNNDGSVVVEVDDFDDDVIDELNYDTLNECEVYVYNDINDVIDELTENCHNSTLMNCHDSLPKGYGYYNYFVLDLTNEVIECYTTLNEIINVYVDGVDIVEVSNEN